MPTRDELLEALHHHTATRARTTDHGQQAALLTRIDAILDALSDLEEPACTGS